MIFLMFPLVANAEETPLIHLIVKDQPVENGKMLDMEFHEVNRQAESSTV